MELTQGIHYKKYINNHKEVVREIYQLFFLPYKSAMKSTKFSQSNIYYFIHKLIYKPTNLESPHTTLSLLFFQKSIIWSDAPSIYNLTISKLNTAYWISSSSKYYRHNKIYHAS